MAYQRGSARGGRKPGALLLWLLIWLGPVLAGCVSTSGYGVAFAHGVLAFQRGEDEEAARRFRQAIRRDRREGTARHWLGLTYLRLGRREEAIDQLEASLRAERPPTAGRERALADLELARKAAPKAKLREIVTPTGSLSIPPIQTSAKAKEVPPRWEGRIGIEAVADSNPELMPTDLPFSVFGLTNASSDSAAEIGLRLDHQPIYGRRGWSLGLSAAGNHSAHQELDDLDLSLARGTVSVAWGRDPNGYVTGPLGLLRIPSGDGRLTLLLQGSGAHAWLGGSSFLRLMEGSASFTIRESVRTMTRIDLEIRDRDYSPAQIDFYRGGREAAFGVGQSFFFGRPDRYVRISVRTGEIRGTQGSDASFHEAAAEAETPISSRWSLYLRGARTEERFGNPISNLAHLNGPARDDSTWRFTARSTIRLRDRLLWTTRGSWSQRDSNVELAAGEPLLDYRRTVFSTGFEWSF